ncbi:MULTISPECIES: MtnX-like HAD-IB family phosphatase [unclassified Fusibacter]|uniref:MtnX-like HAD-IB family phosphatase n=1 Tax=unclassified Fusibacter TaxID=2624464 RepID=UPI001011BD93|nr:MULTISPECIES: MtnX-like HAD-IB family phosphatase [unclassified Fusibacter]MCK8060370.1 MtnX-like HAD-IB family phosphatase [Fusibacter sp. A2]NPE20341.1 MtnX-like HAD-IB family phosphatase [Fusibacter sp. A1]RXV63547.1 2,3-diketo-5-methylthio-1-phosphopentane phosphatase [Fusibacter sp. A1]
MKKLFVSDFDGTATALDFYKIVLNKIGDEGWTYVREHRKTGKVDYHFLNKIFGWHQLTDSEYESLIGTIELDGHLRALLTYLSDQQIDFKFVSAGFDRYIQDVLKKEGYEHVDVITNPGFFEEGIMRMAPNVQSPFYSDVFGIDKGEVMRSFKKEYDRIYFAGDTEPDLSAALEADVIFAKGELIELVKQAGKDCIEFETYEEVVDHLKRGV